jgi:class 3 adenylate cyclase
MAEPEDTTQARFSQAAEAAARADDRAAYEVYRNRLFASRARWAWGIALAFFLISLVPEYVARGGDMSESLLVRLVIFSVYLGAGYRLKRTRGRHQGRGDALVVACAVLFDVEAAIVSTGGGASPLLQSILLLAPGAALLFPLKPSEVLSTCTPLLLLHAGALLAAPGVGDPIRMGANLFFLACSVLLAAVATALVGRLRRDEWVARRALGRARERAEELLLNVLPAAIARRLERRAGAIADRAESVTVIFADLVGFTELSEGLSPERLVELLNRIFVRFDQLAEAEGVEKIKTIGDAYLAAVGIPEPRADHARVGVRFARGLLAILEKVNQEEGVDLRLRVGLHSGPVVAGVIGHSKFCYDLWGDTVNTASRMESHGVPGRIQCSQAFADALGGDVPLESRGTLEVKGKGPMATYLLG